MNRASPLLLIALALTACGSSSKPDAKPEEVASQSGCNRFYPGGKMPEIASAKVMEGTKPICMRAFSLLHSSKSRGPLWVAEQLTDTNVKLARELQRNDDFHPEIQLNPSERAELSDYKASGYDRGHMAPSGDMPSEPAQQESFSLANMVPQAAGLNRRSWEDLEKSVRRQTSGGTVYVLTGPLYVSVGGRLKTTHRDGRVPVPSHIYKAIFAEGRGAVVFIATNEDRPVWMSITLKQFSDTYGINPFPGVPEQYLNVNGALDGSLTRSSKKGADGTAGQNQELDPNALVRAPDGQMVTVALYRNSYHHDPSPEELVKK